MDLAQLRAEMRADLANLTKAPAGLPIVEAQIESAACALVELCALDADTAVGYDTNRRLARHVAGLRPGQAENLTEAITRTIGTVAVLAARQSGRPVAELIDPATAAVMTRLAEVDRDAFEWATAALTVTD